MAEKKARQVLIVAHLDHASPRMPGIAAYLPEFGWQPVILTAPFSKKVNASLRIEKTPYRDPSGFIKKLFNIKPGEDARTRVKSRFGVTAKKSWLDFFITRAAEVVNYPDEEKGWKPFAIKKGEEFFKREEADVIISSSSPVTAHLIARELKRRHKIPWIADLRDLWSQNHNYSYSPLRRLIDRRLELKTLSGADALVTVSQLWAEDLRVLHSRDTVYTITNGFAPSDVNDPPAKLTAKFTITYTGAIYPGKQEPARLFIALSELISSKAINSEDIEVRFYTHEHAWLDKEIAIYNLSGIVKHYAIVPQRVAVEKQRESQLLLLLNWEDQRVRGWHPLKGFEYLAARRPIISLGGSGEDVTKKLLEETKAGVYCRTAEEVKTVIQDYYTEYKQTGKVSFTGDIDKINQYSHREMARRFAGILDQLRRE